MLDTETGEVVILTLMHEGDQVREFYSKLPRPVLVGIEATGSMPWFLNLMEELGIECRVGHPATIRAAAPRRQTCRQIIDERHHDACGLLRLSLQEQLWRRTEAGRVPRRPR